MAEHLDQYYCDTELCLMTPSGRRRNGRSSSPSDRFIGAAAGRREDTGKETQQELQEEEEEQQQIAMLHGERITSKGHDLTESHFLTSTINGTVEIGMKHDSGHCGGGGRKQDAATPSSFNPWGGAPSMTPMSTPAPPQLSHSGHLAIKRSFKRFLDKRKKRDASHHPFVLPPP